MKLRKPNRNAVKDRHNYACTRENRRKLRDIIQTLQAHRRKVNRELDPRTRETARVEK